MKNIVSDFTSGTRAFCAHPLNFMERNGSSVAGFLWTVGSTVQLAMGTIAMDPRELAAAGAGMMSNFFYLFSARSDANAKAGAALGEVNAALTLLPQLQHHNPAVWAGFGLFTGTSVVNFFSKEIAKTFKDSKSMLVRETLGTPRRVAVVTMAARAPVIADAIAHHNPHVAIPYGIWLLADISLGLSRPEGTQPRAEPAELIT